MKLIGQIFHLMFLSEKYILPEWAYQILGENLGIKGEIAQFFRTFEGNVTKMFLKDWGSLNCIFLVKKSLSVTKFCGRKVENNAFLSIFQLVPLFCPSPFQYFGDNWILFIFHRCLIFQTSINQNLISFSLS